MVLVISQNTTIDIIEMYLTMWAQIAQVVVNPTAMHTITATTAPCLIEMFQNAKICKLNQYRIYCMKYMQQAKQKLLYIENVFVNHSMIHLSNRTYLGPTFMFGISGCLVYAGQIIRYFLHWNFI